MAWTDHPIEELGDEFGRIAPIRACAPVDYDGDKYSIVDVGWVRKEIKSGYIYTTKCRCGEGAVVDPESYTK